MADKQQQQREMLIQGLQELQRLRAKLDAATEKQHQPLAVIGWDDCFPGAEQGGESLWRLLAEAREARRPMACDRWDLRDFYHPQRQTPGKFYNTHAGLIDDPWGFDADFFAIPPQEAEAMDPQQRLLLETGWRAFENAGYAPGGLSGSNTGVFVGMMTNDYENMLAGADHDAGALSGYEGTGTSSAVAAGRLAWQLGLKGPTLVINTACSSSLVAVHAACQSLRLGECDMALAGGVSLSLSPVNFVMQCHSQMLSPDGRSKAFDAAADGLGRSEGCGMVVIRRLADALRDNDPIAAVIRGSAINHDGRSQGLTAPNGLAQRDVLSRALANAQVDARSVGYVEAHGTGTPLGDPIEMEAIEDVYGQGRDDAPLWVGSVKTNLGHCEAAAGVAGLAKALLMLRHRTIPAHLHFQRRNPAITADERHIRIPVQSVAWQPHEAAPLRAAVSAFGLSGTNAHLILEQAPEPELTEPAPATPQLLTISAKSRPALRALLANYAHTLGASDAALADICFTARTGRDHFLHRLAVMAEEKAPLKAQLEAILADDALLPAPVAASPQPVWLFSGQGSQYQGMSRTLYQRWPVYRRHLDRCAQQLDGLLDIPLKTLLWEETQGALNQTQYTQPALFSLQYALAMLWQSWGITPDAVLGHSIGEYAAACVAGVFSPEDALTLAAARGRLMVAHCPPGAMLVVLATEAEITPLLQGTAATIAVFNGVKNHVVAGAAQDVDQVQARARQAGLIVHRLAVSHAFHSAAMEPMLAEFRRVAEGVTYRMPRLTYVSSRLGRVAGQDVAHAGYWTDHIRDSVRFRQGLDALRGAGKTLFMEIGPGTALTSIGRATDAEKTGDWLPSLTRDSDERETLAGVLKTLYERGLNPDWRAVADGESRRRVPLPGYPFQHQTFRHPLAQRRHGARQAAQPAAQPHLLPGARISSPLPGEQWSVQLSLAAPAFLADHKIGQEYLLPAAVWIETALATLGGNAVLESFTLHASLALPSSGDVTLHTVVTPENNGDDFHIRIYSNLLPGGENGAWRLHASGRLSLRALPPAPAVAQMAYADEDIGDLYPLLARKGYHYGPAFRALAGFQRGETGYRARICLPQGEPAFAGRSDPRLLDACFQAAGLALGHADETTYLPLSFGPICWYRPCPTALWCDIAFTDGQEACADLRLYDDDGVVCATLSQCRFVRIDSRLLTGARAEDEAVEACYGVSWTAQPQDEAGELAAPGICWLFGDEGPAMESFGRELTRLGAQVEYIAAGTTFARAGDHRWRIDPQSPEDLARLRDALAPQAPVRIWYCPGSAAEESIDVRAALPGYRDWRALLNLIQTLLSAEPALPCTQFALITRAAQTVREGEKAAGLAPSLLWGMARTLRRELPLLDCRLLDAGQRDDDGEAQHLCRWLLQDTDGREAAYRDGVNYALRATSLPALPGDTGSLIDPGAGYLITGAFGALGLQTAQSLAARGARHLVLIGRNAPPDSARPALDALESAGVTLYLCQADVADYEALSQALREQSAGCPPLKGVAHCAMHLADAPYAAQDQARYLQALLPKVNGAWNLHRLTRGLALDWFVLFSSLAAVTGSYGQSNYAAGNAFMDALAAMRRAAGLPAQSINWGGWAGSGGAQRYGLERYMADSAISLIAPEQGMAWFFRLIQLPDAQTLVLPVNWQKAAGALPEAYREIFARQTAQAGHRAGPRVKPAFLLRLEAAAAPQRERMLQRLLSEKIAELLRRPSADDIDPDAPLFEMGLDSLTAMALRNHLHEQLGVELPPTLLFNQPTMRHVLRYLLDDALAPAATNEDAPPPAQDAAAPSDAELKAALLRALADD